MKTKFIVLLFLLAFMLSSQRLVSQWMQTNGPYGGSIKSFASVGSDLFAGTWGGGAFRSTDNGFTWSEASNGLPSKQVFAIVALGTRLFALPMGEVCVSTDDGATWQKGTGIPAVWPTGLCAMDTILLASTNDRGIWRFVNFDGQSGAAWSTSNTGITDSNITCLATVQPYLFAGSLGSGVFRSTDGGLNWSQVNSGLSSTRVRALSSASAGLLAGTDAGVFLSTDFGASWTNISANLPNTIFQSVAASGNRLFAATNGMGTYRSTNMGTTWSELSIGRNEIVYAIKAIGDIVIMGSDACTLFRSVDAGLSWTRHTIGSAHNAVAALAISGPIIYAAVAGDGLFRSNDNGATWNPMNAGLTDRWIQKLTVSDSSLLAGTTLGGIFRSARDEIHWYASNFGLKGLNIHSLAVANLVAYATNDSGVFRSTDDGRTWKAVNNGLPFPSWFRDMANPIAAFDSSVFVGAGIGAVYRSSNLGDTWQLTRTGLETECILSLGIFGSSLFAGTPFGRGVFLSTDFGSTWLNTSMGLPQSSIREFAGINGRVIALAYGGFDPDGVSIFSGQGTHWSAFNTGLPNPCLLSLAASKTDLFLGTCDGVWRRPASELTNAPTVGKKNPIRCELSQNYPNPFNPTTTIEFTLSVSGSAILDVYNILGEKISTLAYGRLEAGRHEIRWAADGLPTGVYFYRLSTGTFTAIKKLILAR